MLGSPFSRYKSPAFVHLDFTPTFTPVLLRKDFDLGLAAARDAEVTMPLTASVLHLIQAAIGRGHRHDDFLSLFEVQASASGVELTKQ